MHFADKCPSTALIRTLEFCLWSLSRRLDRVVYFLFCQATLGKIWRHSYILHLERVCVRARRRVVRSIFLRPPKEETEKALERFFVVRMVLCQADSSLLTDPSSMLCAAFLA